MIKNFVHKGLKRFFTQDDRSLLSAKDCPRISRILDRLDGALDAMDMKVIWSVTVSKNWRITFRFENGDAHDVSLEDYH